MSIENEGNYEVDEPGFGNADQLLPSWMTSRMMTDSWCFALVMTSGQVIHISSIISINQAASGELWADVELADSDWSFGDSSPVNGKRPIRAVCDRKTATINCSHVMLAMELSGS